MTQLTCICTERTKTMGKKWIALLMSAVLVLSTVGLSGCGGNSQEKDVKDTPTTAAKKEDMDKTQTEDTQSSVEDTEYPLTITDGLGDEITFEKEPERVISLAPANTEILFALGAGDRIKGRTDYCSYPEEASEVESIGTYSEPNTELIISMEPDVVFATDYIDDSIREQIESTGAKVVVYTSKNVYVVLDLIIQMGLILNLNENAAELVDSMNTELEEIEQIVASNQEEKSVFVDLGSFYSVGPGALLYDMLDRIGVTNITADTETAYPQLSVESIIEKNPDIYISLYSSPDELKQTAGLDELDCIKNNNIIFFEALSQEADTIQRPSPRVVEGIRLLAEKIYPDLF